VTNKTDFGFHDRIYGTFIKLVTTFHKSLSSTGHTRLLSTLHYYITPLYSPSRLLTVTSHNSLARTPRKAPSSIVKNACLLVRYLAMDVLLLTAYASGCVY
jgi:hypothetical protein